MRRIAVLALLIAVVACGARVDPDALWKIVHGACVPHAEAHQAPTPCAAVDLADHYAVLKDNVGAEQFLLIPTDRISGIESPVLLDANTPNYWGFAWQARTRMTALAPRKLAPDEIGLAINSPSLRTQNQMHIHIDCVKAAVRDELRRVILGPYWQPITVDDVPYEVRMFNMSESPFILLQPEAILELSTFAKWSMASVGDDVLLATRFEAAENVLDHQCGSK